jgi:hypothetical protein
MLAEETAHILTYPPCGSTFPPDLATCAHRFAYFVKNVVDKGLACIL